MRVVVIDPPSPIVSWEEMKIHGKIEEESEKAYVETLISAATGWIDGPAGWLGRSIGVQVLELRLADWPCDFDSLPYGPFIGLVSITYIDPDGAEQDYPVSDPILINMPATRGQMGDVRIRYRVGYGTASDADPPVWTNTPPAQIKVAVMMLATSWYENRQPAIIGATVEKLPFAIDALLQPFRVYR